MCFLWLHAICIIHVFYVGQYPSYFLHKHAMTCSLYPPYLIILVNMTVGSNNQYYILKSVVALWDEKSANESSSILVLISPPITLTNVCACVFFFLHYHSWSSVLISLCAEITVESIINGVHSDNLSISCSLWVLSVALAHVLSLCLSSVSVSRAACGVSIVILPLQPMGLYSRSATFTHHSRSPEAPRAARLAGGP